MESRELSSSSHNVPNQAPPVSYAAIALALTVQEWSNLGTGIDNETSCTNDIEILVDRVTSLLLVRIAAVVAATRGLKNKFLEFYACETNRLTTEKSLFSDFSTSTICRTVLMQQQPWHILTPSLTPQVIEQLRHYVHRMLSGYNDVPYHNREHAFHVVLSTNKMLDMMLQRNHTQQSHVATPTFGLRDDPIQLMGLLFAALIHDVEHVGIPNRQLALESDPLAIQFNDISIAEQRSLFIGFTELLKDDYIDLRTVMFGTASVGVESGVYQRFRMTVVNLVLNTDIASPERAQLAKSKYKEAFGEKVRRLSNHGNATSAMSISSNSENRLREHRGAAIPESQTRQRTTSECSDDYTIPVTPEASEPESDTDDGMPNGQQTTTTDPDDVIQCGHQTKTTATARLYKSDTTLLEISSSNLMIHQAQLDKLDYLIWNASQSNSPGSMDDPYEIPRADDCEQHYYPELPPGKPAYDGHPKQKSSSLPGKLECWPPSVPPTSLFPIGLKNKRLRQMSAPHIYGSHRKRLGIRRSMDLSGEALETYSAKKRSVLYPNLQVDPLNVYIDDQPDELKASVVLETIMTAADVAHNLQGWRQMVKWSGRLYMELRRAYIAKRSSMDPKNRWYENQIGFIESYLLPLAERLDATGVFGEQGMAFIEIVKNNRDQWLTDGMSVTESIVSEGDATPMEAESIPLSTNDQKEMMMTDASFPIELKEMGISIQSLSNDRVDVIDFVNNPVDVPVEVGDPFDVDNPVDVAVVIDINLSQSLQQSQTPSQSRPQNTLLQNERWTSGRVTWESRLDMETMNDRIELIKPRGIRVCLAKQWW